MRRKQGGFTLQGKMVAIFAFFLPIVVFLIGITLTMWIQRTSRENMLEKYTVTDKGVSAELYMLRRNDESIINGLSQSMNVQEAITEPTTLNAVKWYEQFLEMKRIMDASASVGSVTGIYIFGGNGRRFYSGTMMDLADIDAAVWADMYATATLQPRKARWVVAKEDFFSSGSRTAYLYIVNTILTRVSLRETIGISVARVSYPRYVTTLRYTLSSPGEYAFVLDENGNILMHSHDRMKTGIPPDAEIAAYIHNEEGIVEAKPLGGVFFHTKEKNATWTVVHFVPDDVLNEIPASAFAFIWVIMLLSFLIMLTGLTLFSRTITKPVHRLSVALRHFGEGRLDERIPINGKPQDEIGELSKQFNAMADELTQYMLLMEESHATRAKLELSVLENQINPHFLYNVLDLINWKATHAGQSDISEMTVHLARFFRLGLHKGRDFITVADEVEHAKEYLHICKMRYCDGFTFAFNVDSALLKYKTKKILLQPMLENCIKYGLRADGVDNHLAVEVCGEGEHIRMTVSDNGPGMTEETLVRVRARMRAEDTGEGMDSFGLFNLNARLAATYGEEYMLDINSASGVGTTVSIQIPKRL